MDVTELIHFSIIDLSTLYNGVLEKPSKEIFGMVLTKGQQSIKFPKNQGVGCIHRDSTTNKDCLDIPKEDNISIGDSTIDILDIREDLHIQRGKPMEDVIKFAQEGIAKKYPQIRSRL